MVRRIRSWHESDTKFSKKVKYSVVKRQFDDKNRKLNVSPEIIDNVRNIHFLAHFLYNEYEYDIDFTLQTQKRAEHGAIQSQFDIINRKFHVSMKIMRITEYLVANFGTSNLNMILLHTIDSKSALNGD